MTAEHLWFERLPALADQARLLDSEWRAVQPGLQGGPLPVLYHYTTSDGLKGILASRRIWATAINYVNDNQELFHGNTKIEIAFRERLRGIDPVLGGLFWDKLYNSLPGFSLEPNDRRADLFICCFCESGDLLSQWRGYAALGGGYALGLQPIGFGGDGGTIVLPPYRLRKVIYEETIQDRLTELIVSKTSDLYFAEVQRRGQSQAAWLADELTDYLCYQVSEMLYCSKHLSFSEEKEWRIAHELPYEPGYPQVRFRTSGGKLIPYVELNVFPDGEAARCGLKLVSLTHGPTLNPAWTKKSLAMLAEHAGFGGCEVRGSAIPLNP
jgi:hypothetical protein